MKIDLTYSEVDEVLASIRFAAHSANKEAAAAGQSGYPPEVEKQMKIEVSNLYALADNIDEQRRLYGSKQVGSSATIDPFDTPMRDEPKTANDPIEW